MATIYLLIVLSPLAPCARNSKLLAHAITGECSGDCKIDGCSLERSATHTCCCGQKRLTAKEDYHRHQDSGSYETASIQHADSPKKVASCCTASAQNTHKENNGPKSVSAPPKSAQKAKTTTVRSTPCGSGKLFALLSIETAQHFPSVFMKNIHSPLQCILTACQPAGLISRHGDPPDPPPIITVIS
jgi:hypothetical protein